MTPQDLEQLTRIVLRLPPVGKIALLNPCREERRLLRKATVLTRRNWDLNGRTDRAFDLIIACNVLMYANEPASWISNILASCRYYLLIEPIRRRRSARSELGEDGDSCRISVGDHKTDAPRSFNLDALGTRVLAVRTFDGGANEYGPAFHLVALLQGDLTSPIIRVDDYPTGVRPILNDLGPLHRVLSEIDGYGLTWHLGIVPALLTDDMFGFLRTLRWMVPLCHGYDHAYSQMSAKLIAAGDPMNQRGTVGGFNEFAGRNRKAIVEALSKGRRLLEEGLGKPVTGYVPPCNFGDRATGAALIDAGFTHYFSEKKIPGCPLPRIGSDFYGRSPEHGPRHAGAKVITLHVTWEVDVLRNGDAHSLPRLMAQLAERAGRSRAEAVVLAPWLFA